MHARVQAGSHLTRSGFFAQAGSLARVCHLGARDLLSERRET